MLQAKIMVRSVLQTTIERREEAGNDVDFRYSESVILAKDGKGDLAVWKDCACAAQTGKATEGDRARNDGGGRATYTVCSVDALVYSHTLGGTMCAHVARENTCTR
jgi:hypothetical protein